MVYGHFILRIAGNVLGFIYIHKGDLKWLTDKNIIGLR